MIIPPYKSVIYLRKQDRGFMKKESTEIKFNNKTRRFCEEGDCYLDEDRPFKRSRRQGDKYENLVVTSDHIRCKFKLLNVVQRV